MPNLLHFRSDETVAGEITHENLTGLWNEIDRHIIIMTYKQRDRGPESPLFAGNATVGAFYESLYRVHYRMRSGQNLSTPFGNNPQ
jgi:hypothetical protein